MRTTKAGSAAPPSVAPAVTGADIAAVKDLFLAYQAWLGVDLCFQGFDEEMARFPHGYDVLLLGRIGDAAAGAVGLRPIDSVACEMKRLYVPNAFQRHGLGRLLSIRLLDEARARGYRLMRLDTLERLQPAIALYRSLGFTECGAYYDNPLDHVVYMECRL